MGPEGLEGGGGESRTRTEETAHPCHKAVLKAQAPNLGLITATFVLTRRLSGAWERCCSQGLGHRPWLGMMTSNSVWTSVITSCHANPIAGSVHFYFTNSHCSPGVHWFVFAAILEPAMHVFIVGLQENLLHMHPLFSICVTLLTGVESPSKRCSLSVGGGGLLWRPQCVLRVVVGIEVSAREWTSCCVLGRGRVHTTVPM